MIAQRESSMPVLQVVRQTYWSNQHIGGQLTEIEIDGVHAYVRENVRYDSFGMSANERLGLKRGQPVKGVQVLELAVDPLYWEMFAQAVRQVDELDREVVRSSKFTAVWAQAWFENK